jgi:hypothetical protein
LTMPILAQSCKGFHDQKQFLIHKKLLLAA